MRVPAPAKLNLFLHITGRRSDGYHLLQSLFCLIDWQDMLTLSPASDGRIQRMGSHSWPAESDLTVRAAQALKAWAVDQGIPDAQRLGCTIETQKEIPAGAGLGGGSSDAASCLLGLRALWGLPAELDTLMSIGLKLGADVPFFLLGESALAEGVGEALRPMTPRVHWFVVAVPAVHVPTVDIFRDPALERNQAPLTLDQILAACEGSLWQLGTNNLEPVACTQFPEVGELLLQMRNTALHQGLPCDSVRMSGSGGAAFASCESGEQAQHYARALQAAAATRTQIRVCRQIAQHPARALLQYRAEVVPLGSRQVG